MKKLVLLALAAVAVPASASYTNNQWQNGWPQHANFSHSLCGNSAVIEHNRWQSLYIPYC